LTCCKNFVSIICRFQVDGNNLSDNCQTGDVVWNRALGGEEPTREYNKCSGDENVTLDV